ncbi:hypothetical protein FDP41_009202 [Naegleria fowleri]|uniref:Methyltransferase domain-containing protein n=1 Tax=Naegleria fowleri TaxID=5763 RepID=A0A6A5BH02_NAEFO|nr:uncharacterized protein FDP41_009202 [Naegleria fowleri]KAF0972299.1 hypothetical protein FDP41_009202 [Naegleria fowleri]CAG4709759.1 unnamed protein product [Naegleria fowleri]
MQQQPSLSSSQQANSNHRILNDQDLKNKYNATFSKVFQQIYEPSTNITAQALISSLCINNKKRILDIGCGAGGSGFLIASQMPPDCELFCLDLSPDMLQLARERCDILTREPFSRKIHFVEGSAEKLPFEDETFDAVFSNYSLHVIPNPDEMLKEVARVLKTGGMSCMSVWGRPEKSPLFTLLQKASTECKKRFLKEKNSSEGNNNKVLQLQNPPPRSQFHLSNLELLRERVLNTILTYGTLHHEEESASMIHGKSVPNNGISTTTITTTLKRKAFSQCLAWYQFQPFQAFNAREFAELNILSPDFQQWIQEEEEEGSKEKRTLEILQLLEEMAQQVMMMTNSEPIGNEALIVWMKKE